MLAMNTIEMLNVTKTFGKHVAVDDLSLSVPKGCVYGFIGPNGSGKTTTMRMIMNVLYPDSGTIQIFDQPIRQAYTDRIGYMPEERGLYKRMKVREVLELQLTGKRDSQQIVAEIMSQTRVTSFELTRPSCNQQRAETRARSSTNRPATKSNQSTSSKSFRRTKEPQIPSYWCFPTGFDAANYIPLSRLAREYSTHAKTGQRRVSATMRRTRP
jgi:ABC-type multidrug transport system ATPase subunit